MALHPFQTFRRHQKKWLAALTIMCMIIFIGSFGRGDPLDRMMAFFGASRSRATTVATVYGNKVTDADLDNLRRQRDLANQIVSRMTGIARDQIIKDFNPIQGKGLDEFEEFDRFTLRPIVQELMRRLDSDRSGYGAFFAEQYKPQIARAHEQLQGMEQRLLGKSETHRAEKVRQLMSVLEYEMWARSRTGAEYYFGGTPKVDDLLDFQMWRQQADKLGIFLTQDDIRKDINQEAFDIQPLPKDAIAALNYLQGFVQVRGRREISIDEVYTALGDELRVYLAKFAVLGDPPGVRFYRYMGLNVYHTPATATPEEFWKFYLDNRTTLRVEMLPIKVEDFLSKVGQPPAGAEQELRDLFDRYKDAEYTPDRDEPAFHEPKRVAVEWVGARADSTSIRKQADQFILAVLAATPSDPFPALSLMTQVVETYDLYKSTKYSMPGLLDASFEKAFIREPAKPSDVTALLGQAMGTFTMGVNPGSVFPTYAAGLYTRNRAAVAADVQREAQRRAGVEATIVGAALNPWTAAGLVEYASTAPQALPLALVKKEVFEQVRNGLSRHLVDEIMGKLRTDLEKLKGKPEPERKKEANEYVAKAVKEFGLTHGATERPRDIFSMADDKGLEPLYQSYAGSGRRTARLDYGFGQQFFDTSPLYLPRPSLMGDSFLYWKTEDKKAYTPTFEEAKPKVIEAWRFQKARELARQEAEKIQEEVRKRKSQSDGLKYLRDESARHPNWGEMFYLDEVARLKPSALAGLTRRQYEPYVPDEEKIKARPGLVDQLLRSLKENGDSTITWNRPESIYYVVLLTDIARPNEARFYGEYRSLSLSSDNLWQVMEVERRVKYDQAVLKEMRTAAGAANGKWDVPDDVRKRIEGRESGSEE